MTASPTAKTWLASLSAENPSAGFGTRKPFAFCKKARLWNQYRNFRSKITGLGNNADTVCVFRYCIDGLRETALWHVLLLP